MESPGVHPSGVESESSKDLTDEYLSRFAKSIVNVWRDDSYVWPIIEWDMHLVDTLPSEFHTVFYNAKAVLKMNRKPCLLKMDDEDVFGCQVVCDESGEAELKIPIESYFSQDIITSRRFVTFKWFDRTDDLFERCEQGEDGSQDYPDKEKLSTVSQQLRVVLKKFFRPVSVGYIYELHGHREIERFYKETLAYFKQNIEDGAWTIKDVYENLCKVKVGDLEETFNVREWYGW